MEQQQKFASGKQTSSFRPTAQVGRVRCRGEVLPVEVLQMLLELLRSTLPKAVHFICLRTNLQLNLEECGLSPQKPYYYASNDTCT